MPKPAPDRVKIVSKRRLSCGVNRIAIELAASFIEKGSDMQKITTLILDIWNDESGISSVEYALLLAFVAAGIIAGAEFLSNAVTNEMEATAACIGGGGC